MRRSFDPLPFALSLPELRSNTGPSTYWVRTLLLIYIPSLLLMRVWKHVCTLCAPRSPCGTVETQVGRGNPGKGILPIDLVLCKADFKKSLSSIIQIPATSLLNTHPSSMRANLFAFEAYLCFCLPPTWEGCS